MTFRSFRTALTAVSALLLACLSFSSWAETREQQAWQLIDQGALVIDVRTTGEYASGHLNNALHIPYEQVVERFEQIGVAKDLSVVLYCRSGNRSGKAEQMLADAGYQVLHNGGGLNALLQAAPR